MTGITGTIRAVLSVICVVKRLDILSFSCSCCFDLSMSWMLAEICIGHVSVELEIDVSMEVVEYNDDCCDCVAGYVVVEGVRGVMILEDEGVVGLVKGVVVILDGDAVGDVSDVVPIFCLPYSFLTPLVFLNDLPSFHGHRSLISNPIGAISCLSGPPFTHFPCPNAGNRASSSIP